MSNNSFINALKFWWSFTWRSYLLMIPAFAVMMFVQIRILSPENSVNPAFALIGLGIMCIAQIFAIMWTSRSKGSSLHSEKVRD